MGFFPAAFAHVVHAGDRVFRCNRTFIGCKEQGQITLKEGQVLHSDLLISFTSLGNSGNFLTKNLLWGQFNRNSSCHVLIMSCQGNELLPGTFKSASHLRVIQDPIADIRETQTHINQLLLGRLITHMQPHVAPYCQRLLHLRLAFCQLLDDNN